MGVARAISERNYRVRAELLNAVNLMIRKLKIRLNLECFKQQYKQF